MINHKRILAIIPARGGSKGVSRKNIRYVGGKPLIAWTIEQAHKSSYIDRTIVSTNDREIAEVAMAFNCDVPFLRPNKISEDESTTMDCIFHALDAVESDFDYVVLLQPTSPLRKSSDIDACIVLADSSMGNQCVSVVSIDKPLEWLFIVNDNKLLEPLYSRNNTVFRRQDGSDLFFPNGAVYVSSIDTLKTSETFYNENTKAYIMPKKRSIDIDTEEDLNYLEFTLNNMNV